MTDDPKDDGKLPTTDADLLAELEEWDQTFDSLHAPDAAGAGTPLTALAALHHTSRSGPGAVGEVRSS